MQSRLIFCAIILATGIFTVKSQTDGSSEPSTSDLPSSTTTAPPSLIRYANYKESCAPMLGGLITVLCRTYSRTVHCDKSKLTCECNLGDDAVFDEESSSCVGKAGSMCFLEATSLGKKVCVKNADCYTDQPGGYNVGKCECLYGFNEPATMDGTCEDNPEVPENLKSTVRPTTPRPTLPAAATTPSKATDDGSSSSTTENNNSGASGLQTSAMSIMIVSLCIILRN